MTIIPNRCLFSDHAIQRLKERFSISPYSVSDALDNRKLGTLLPLHQGENTCYRMLWIEEDGQLMFIKQDISNGVIITIWNTLILEKVTGYKIQQADKERAQKLFFNYLDSVKGSQLYQKPLLEFVLPRKSRPIVKLIGRMPNMGISTSYELGRCPADICKMGWKEKSNIGNIEKLKSTPVFNRWIQFKCRNRKIRYPEDIISIEIESF